MSKQTLDFATPSKAYKAVFDAAKILPDPDPILKKMGKDITELKDTVLADNRVESAIYAQRLPALDNYKIFFSEQSAETKLLEEYFGELNMGALYADIFDAVLFGYSVCELNWIKGDSLFLPKIAQKPQEWFAHRNGEWVFRTKENKDGVPLPKNKFLITQNRATYTNPYGKKLLSKLFWWTVFRKNGIKFFFTFAEKYGMPWAIGKLPRNSTEKARDDMLDSLEAMVADAIGVVPDDSSVELLTVQTKGGDSIYKSFLEMCNEEIAITLLGQNLTTQVKGGSYASSQTHKKVLEEITESDKTLVEGALNKLIKIVYEVNRKENPPKLELYKGADIDKELADRDEVLHRCGVRFTKNYYKKAYGLEEEDFEIAEPKVEGAISEFAEAREDIDLDRVLESSDISTLLDKDIELLVAELAKAGSYEDALEGIATLFPDMGDKEVSDTLAKAIFIAEAKGLTDAVKL